MWWLICVYFLLRLSVNHLPTLMTGCNRNTVLGSRWLDVKVTFPPWSTHKYFLVHMCISLHCCSHFNIPPVKNNKWKISYGIFLHKNACLLVKYLLITGLSQKMCLEQFSACLYSLHMINAKYSVMLTNNQEKEQKITFLLWSSRPPPRSTSHIFRMCGNFWNILIARSWHWIQLLY